MPRPRLTLVLVVHRDQAYVRECVASTLGQSFRDVEVVAVDDASPDHAPEVLDALAARDERLTVRHLERALPLGEARSLGLESARGEYVWFVEATDVLPEGALEAVVARLEETEPDVLVVDEARAGALGAAKPGPHGDLLRSAAAAGAFTLDDRPEAVALAPDAWSKVFRLDFLRALGAPPTSGRGSELALTYPALLAADRIAVLARTAYERRRPPNAAADAHVHGTPFDVFTAYDAVFAFADGAAVPSSRRELLPLAMLRHYVALLDELPERQRREFFVRAHESYVRHARGGERAPAGLELSVRLAREGRYGALEALRLTREGRRVARRRTRAIRRLPRTFARPTRGRILRRYYAAQLRRPIDPDLAVFAAYWYRGYSCNPRAIYEKLRELVPSVRGVWIVAAEHAASLPAGVPHVVSGTREYYRLLARAKYFVNNVNFPNDVVKRRGTIHVQTHHGTPLKKMGLDLRDAFFAGKRMNFEL
ncbi:MAG: bifunctional glycosyltransferase family 2 protein/CDP-glycerol:glycerophosphate glycerophosphotransferase, partial [Actinobacteria bacterium]|nr:bifunctional glycosyltransferase family 2 protein/CDP-glycerol:glycerophosphate glycerophosphotransferase [Actinomycetota bacterium]